MLCYSSGNSPRIRRVTVCSSSTSRAVLPEQGAAAVVPAMHSTQSSSGCTSGGFTRGSMFFWLRKMCSAFRTSFWIAFIFCDLNRNHAAVLLFCAVVCCNSVREIALLIHNLVHYTHTQIFLVAFVTVPGR